MQRHFPAPSARGLFIPFEVLPDFGNAEGSLDYSFPDQPMRRGTGMAPAEQMPDIFEMIVEADSHSAQWLHQFVRDRRVGADDVGLPGTSWGCKGRCQAVFGEGTAGVSNGEWQAMHKLLHIVFTEEPDVVSISLEA